MRRNQKGVVLLLVAVLLGFSGCGPKAKNPETSGSSIAQTAEAAVSPDILQEDKKISVRAVKNYIKENEDNLDETLLSAKEKELSVEGRSYDGKEMYFLLYTVEDTQQASLYRIREEEDSITGLDFVASGAAQYMQFDVISITEGSFVTVYSASNTGNGNLLMIDVDKLYGRTNEVEPDYEMLAVDAHYEDLPCSGSSYALSKVFTDGILTPEYKDADGDGNTDIILNGILENYQSEKGTDEYALISKEEVSQLYLYDEKKGIFTLQSSDDLTEKIPLTWSDVLVNNHDMLNEAPYPTVTVKDIVAYHDDVPSVLVVKAENGLYWHYYGYKGITYVILGEEELKETACLNYVVLTDNSYSLANGIQVGMDEEELVKTSLDFTRYTKKQVGTSKNLSTLFLDDKKGLISTLVDKYDSIYYVSGEVESLVQNDEDETQYTQIGLIAVVKDGKVICVATDSPDI